jgi:hypothetical protein
MVDTGLIAQQLRAKGHAVGHIEVVAENAGDYIFVVDGQPLNLTEVRALLGDEAAE